MIKIEYDFNYVKLPVLREEAGLKQWQLAKEVGCSQAHYASIETGRRYPGMLKVLRICSVLGINPSTLFYKRKEPCYAATGPKDNPTPEDAE